VQRTREIGIRMAIGAQGRDVVWMIMREAGILTLIGLAIGIGLALGAARAAHSVIFGLKPRDPLTFSMALLTLSVVAAVASFLPAYRASKLDPVVALREE
jgi:ABC-type antimicrobial peptide transport system permease subunit